MVVAQAGVIKQVVNYWFLDTKTSSHSTNLFFVLKRRQGYAGAMYPATKKARLASEPPSSDSFFQWEPMTWDKGGSFASHLVDQANDDDKKATVFSVPHFSVGRFQYIHSKMVTDSMAARYKYSVLYPETASEAETDVPRIPRCDVHLTLGDSPI
jgi:hypothetical protein